MGNKNKSVSSNEKSQKPKDSKGKKDKKPDSDKKEVAVCLWVKGGQNHVSCKQF